MAGIVAMMAIATLQYAWTLSTKPIPADLHVSLVAVQVPFVVSACGVDSPCAGTESALVHILFP
jgi:hypothetical protein